MDHEPSVVSFLFQPVTIPHLPLVFDLEPTFRVTHPPMESANLAANASAAFPSSLSTSAHSGPAGELNPDLLVAGQVSSRWTSRPNSQEVRPGIEPGPRPYHGRVLPEHLQTIFSSVIPAGIEPALSCMSRRRLRRWTTGSLSVTEVGLEPTGTRLWTSPLCRFAYPVVAGPGVAPGSPGS